MTVINFDRILTEIIEDSKKWGNASSKIWTDIENDKSIGGDINRLSVFLERLENHNRASNGYENIVVRNVFINVAYLRALESSHREFEAEMFDNCRETGVMAHIANTDGVTLGLYEHRNSDDIIVNGARRWSGKPEYGAYGMFGESKHDYLNGFGSSQYREASGFAVRFMENFDEND